jgi:drug/metabolite transporter (DMT)-like permease
MTESQKMFWGGVALIVAGVGTMIWGGYHTTSESHIEIFGFKIGREEREPMSRGQSLFWGIAMVIGGAVLIKFSFAATAAT